MKRKTVEVTQGGVVVKVFKFETKEFTFNDGKQAAGWLYRLYTVGRSGFQEGYVIGSVIMNLPQNNHIGNFFRSINEIKLNDEFKVNLLIVLNDGTEAQLTLDCKCMGIEDTAASAQSGYDPNRGDKPRYKTQQEVEDETRRIPQIVP